MWNSKSLELHSLVVCLGKSGQIAVFPHVTSWTPLGVSRSRTDGQISPTSDATLKQIVLTFLSSFE